MTCQHKVSQQGATNQARKKEEFQARNETFFPVLRGCSPLLMLFLFNSFSPSMALSCEQSASPEEDALASWNIDITPPSASSDRLPRWLPSPPPWVPMPKKDYEGRKVSCCALSTSSFEGRKEGSRSSLIHWVCYLLKLLCAFTFLWHSAFIRLLG